MLRLPPLHPSVEETGTHDSHLPLPAAEELDGNPGSTAGNKAVGAPCRGHRADFHADLSASLTVFLIALPLSLAIALATGALLQAGLVAAAVGGIVAGRLGGAPLQVSGPATGLTVVTAELIQHYGWRTTCAVTVLAGCCQLGLAALRTARSALMVSPAIVHGMLAGVGVTIALAQLHIVLGGTRRAPPSPTSRDCRASWPICSRRRWASAP